MEKSRKEEEDAKIAERRRQEAERQYAIKPLAESFMN